MIPVMPVVFIEKKQADALGYTQRMVRESLVMQAHELGAHPHPEGLMVNGQPEVVYRTFSFQFTPPDGGEPSEQLIEAYAIWIEKDEV